MTADEALAWVEEHDVEVLREPHFAIEYRWTACVDVPAYVGRRGATLVDAVTRLKAKLEAK